LCNKSIFESNTAKTYTAGQEYDLSTKDIEILTKVHVIDLFTCSEPKKKGA
jgi:hypothetical protein